MVLIIVRLFFIVPVSLLSFAEYLLPLYWILVFFLNRKCIFLSNFNVFVLHILLIKEPENFPYILIKSLVFFFGWASLIFPHLACT